MNERSTDPSLATRSSDRARRDEGGPRQAERHARRITDRELQAIIQRSAATQSIPDAGCLLALESPMERTFRCELDPTKRFSLEALP
jgi:hypothetical protein